MNESRADGRASDLRGVRVLVTGHTGFKGAWLAEFLLHLGARVSGVALPPDSPNSLFSLLRLEERIDHHLCDIRERYELARVVRQVEPELILHLAAQALVRRSYREPLLTWETNVIGTLNVLDAANGLGRAVDVVAVTTDKVYLNREWEFPYRETDRLGGHDPYSASKAACELAVASWRASFASPDGVRVATARAGNVIGGGDQSEDRIVPDCFRAWNKGDVVELRQPRSTRPWQHVLDPLSGYLALAANLRRESAPLESCNFGPGATGDRTVEELVRTLALRNVGRRWSIAERADLHEARSLSLAIDRARHRLGWSPRLTFEDAVTWTDVGYSVPADKLPSVVERQIADFHALSQAAEAPAGN